MMEKHCTATLVILAGNPPQYLLSWHEKLQKWLPPGGHTESWENPYETALRETKEELGLALSPQLPNTPIDDVAHLIPPPFCIMEQLIPPHGDQPQHWHVDHEYYLWLPAKISVPTEHDGHRWQWFTEDEVLHTIDTFDNMRWIVRQRGGWKVSKV
jgi:8-oxo-dGTP diphosphatase